MIASVVIAIGMAEIVGGWGRLTRTTAKVSFDWLHFLWSLYILWLSIQYWIGMWSYAEAPFEYTYQVYLLVVPTLFFVFSAYAISPDVPLSGTFNVREYYLAKRRAVFIPLGLFILVAGLADLAIVGSEAVDSNIVVSFLVAVVSASPAFTMRIWVHTFALVLLAAFLAIVLLLGEISALGFDQRWPRRG